MQAPANPYYFTCLLHVSYAYVIYVLFFLFGPYYDMRWTISALKFQRYTATVES